MIIILIIFFIQKYYLRGNQTRRIKFKNKPFKVDFDPFKPKITTLNQ